MAGGAGGEAAALGAHAGVLRGQHRHQGIALLKRELVHAALPVGCDNLHNQSLITKPVMPPAAFRVARSMWWCTGSAARSEEHTSELQSLMRISYAVFCLKKKTYTYNMHIIAIKVYMHNYNKH